MGDVNCDSEVDISDVILLSRYAAEDREAEVTAQGKANSDCNHDGKLNAADCQYILKMIAKLIPMSE